MKTNQMTKQWSRMAATILAAAMLLCSLVGCGNPAANAKQISADTTPSGVLVLSVNPELAVFYDGNGNVEQITARNEDAKAILEGYTGYEGRETREVVSELINKIGQAGYFAEEIESENGQEGRRISIEVEPGSYLPNATFLQDVAADAQKCVADASWNGSVYTVDYDVEDYLTAARPAHLDDDDVEIFFDANGKITKVISGDDAEIKVYNNFNGKDAKQTTLELVDKIAAAGYFVESVEGKGHRVEIEIAPNAQLPQGVEAKQLNDYAKEQLAKASRSGAGDGKWLDCDIEDFLGYDLPDFDDDDDIDDLQDDAEDDLDDVYNDPAEDDDVEIFFDANGKITKLVSGDDANEKVYNSFNGKDAKQTAQELVDKIAAAGYFVKSVEGKNNRVELEIAPNAQLPQDVQAKQLNDYAKAQLAQASWSSAGEWLDRDAEDFLGYDLPDMDADDLDDDLDDADDDLDDDDNDWDDLFEDDDD